MRGRGSRGGRYDRNDSRGSDRNERGERGEPSAARNGGQRGSGSVRELGERGRLAGRLEIPQGVYLRGEEAPDRCVLCSLNVFVLVLCVSLSQAGSNAG